MLKIGLLIFILLSVFNGVPQKVYDPLGCNDFFQVRPFTISSGEPDSIYYKAPSLLKLGDSFLKDNADWDHMQPPAVGLICWGNDIRQLELPQSFDKFQFGDTHAHEESKGETRFVKAQPSRYKDNAALNVRYYDVSQGLSNSYVLDIYQDKHGLLWFATNGGGVCRFDGEDFEIFNENSGIINNMVVSIAADHQQNLWFATMGGLSYYNQKDIFSYAKGDGLGTNYLTDVIVDKSGLVWIGTEDAGLKVFNGRHFYSIDSTLGIGKRITTLHEDVEGRIWIGTFGQGVFLYENGVVNRIGRNDGLLSDMVRDISSNAAGAVAIAYDLGLDLILGDTVKHYSVNQGLPLCQINVVMFDDDGVTVGTNGKGIYRIEASFVSVLNSNHGLNNDDVWALLKDDSGVFWIGTWGGGVNRYDGYSFIHLGLAQGLPADLIPSMTRNSQGINWFGTYGNGFFSMQNSILKHFGKKQGFSGSVVWSMLFDRRDNLWLGTDDSGLWRFDGHTFKVFNSENGFPTDGVWSLCEDKNGSLWIGTVDKGVFRYDGNRFCRIGLTSSVVVSLFEDSKGNIWVSTWGDGMYKIGRTEITHFHDPTGFPAQKVYNVFEDKGGYIWIATNGDGLLVYNGSHFMKIGTQEGIGSDFNFWVEQLSDESLMVGTESGLTHFKPIEYVMTKYPEDNFVRYYRDSVNYRNLVAVDNRLYTIENYGIEDGFIGFDCIGSQYSMLKDDNDNMWIGTGKHLTKFNPLLHIKDDSAPRVHLKEISISLQPVNWEKLIAHKEDRKGKVNIRFDSLSGVYQIPVGLQLGHKNNHLIFDFIAINWKKPDKVLYQYRLVNFDEKWNFPTRISMATYSNLSPGRYIFQVKAMNSDNVWSEPYEFAFEILTPWWQTIWIQLLFLLVVSGFVYLIIRWRIMILKRQKDNLESIVKDRTKEILLQNEEIKSQRDHLNTINIELERLSIVASETLSGVLIADSRGNIEYINRGYTLLLGYTMEQLTQEKGPNLFFIYKNENTLHYIQKCSDERQSVTFSSLFEKSNGTTLWLQVTVTPILTSDGKVNKYVVIYSDITSLKNAQTQIETYNKEITASLRYASRIQTSMLPMHKEIESDFIASFIIYQPLDIVGGDFYWITEHNGSYLIGVIDCTGHGVPGALMTIISYAALNGIVNNETVKNPAKLLQMLNKEVRKMLRQHSSSDVVSDDGLDASFCFITPQNQTIVFAGAKQSLFYAAGNDLVEVRGDRQSIGYIDSSESFRYVNHAIAATENTMFYLASDGYKDMAVGVDGHILGKKKFKELLQTVSQKSMDEQHRFLESLMYRSVAVNNQLDDITLLGFKIK